MTLNFLNNPYSFIHLNMTSFDDIVIPRASKFFDVSRSKIQFVSSTIFEILSYNRDFAPSLLFLSRTATIIYPWFTCDSLRTTAKIDLIFSVFVAKFAFYDYRSALILDCLRKIVCDSYEAYSNQRNSEELLSIDAERSLQSKKRCVDNVLSIGKNAIHLSTMVTLSPQLYAISVVTQLVFNGYKIYQNYTDYFSSNKKSKAYSCVTITISSALLLLQNRALINHSL